MRLGSLRERAHGGGALQGESRLRQRATLIERHTAQSGLEPRNHRRDRRQLAHAEPHEECRGQRLGGESAAHRDQPATRRGGGGGALDECRALAREALALESAAGVRALAQRAQRQSEEAPR